MYLTEMFSFLKEEDTMDGPQKTLMERFGGLEQAIISMYCACLTDENGFIPKGRSHRGRPLKRLMEGL